MILLTDNRTSAPLPEELQEMLAQLIDCALRHEEQSGDWEISLSLVECGEIRNLNREYRGIDRTTDVLSFPLIDFSENNCEPCDGADSLGDIVVCIDTARRQAESYGHSLKRELAFLVTHSMLHLLGYDHMEPEETALMQQKEKSILAMANIPRR